MTVRPAEDEDASGIARIWNAVIEGSTATFTTVLKTHKNITQLIATQPCFVCLNAGEIAGFATFGPFRPGPGYADAAEYTIYLDPGAQRKGLGRRLLLTVEDAARGQGIRHLIAGIGGENTPAVEFHTAMGFAKVAHLQGVGQKFGRRHDLILMQKQL